MKDKVNNELSIGDRVVFNPPKYKGIVFGFVLNFTPKGVRVSYNPTGKQTTNETFVFAHDVVKV